MDHLEDGIQRAAGAAVSLFITDMLALSSVRRARPRVKTSQQDGENAG